MYWLSLIISPTSSVVFPGEGSTSSMRRAMSLVGVLRAARLPGGGRGQAVSETPNAKRCLPPVSHQPGACASDNR
eukprot:2829210-Alexandrium_andersonii.AAC.1